MIDFQKIINVFLLQKSLTFLVKSGIFVTRKLEQ